MFKFLFGKAGTKTVVETQRDTIERALGELNGVLALMADKPVIGVDLNAGVITIDLPEQMPDEALALPSPEPEPEAATETAEQDAPKAA